MECQYLGRGSALARRWHLLRCRECRTAQAADAILRRGIERLNADPAPAAGLTAALAAFGAAPAARPARSRRWKSVLGLRFLPAGALTALVAVGSAGWMAYIDIDPDVPVPTPAMPSPNAYDVLARAVAAIPKSEKPSTIISGGNGDYTHSAINDALLTTLDKALEGPSTSAADGKFRHVYSLKEKDALLRPYSASLALVRQSFAYRYQAPPIRSFNATVPYLSDYRQLARVLKLEADVKMAKGDYAGAANSSLDGMELGSQIASGSGLYGTQVGSACSAMGSEMLWSLIDRLDAAQARAAAARVERLIRLHVPFANIVEEEKWTGIASLKEVLQTPDWRRNVFSVFGGTQAFRENSFAGFLVLLPYSKRTILDDYARVLDGQIARARLPLRWTAANGWGEDIVQRSAAEQRAMRDPVVALRAPATDTTHYIDTAGLQTQSALLAAALALHAYKLEHGRLPHSLKDLTPRYLSAVPADPFGTGEPLHYRDAMVTMPGANGGLIRRPVLYSIGPDGKDDGGRPINTSPGLESPAAGKSSRPRTVTEIKKRYAVKPDSNGDILAGINTH